MLHKQQCICGVILAAGLSSRMNDFKPLMMLKGKALIENAVDSVLHGGADSVVVVTGHRAAEVESLLQSHYGDKVSFVRNHAFAQTDMMHSVQLGCRALPPCEAFFLLPGDMPVVQRSTFHKLLQARPKDSISVVFPTLEGYRKHPPLVDARLIPEILAFQGEGGLRQLWQQHEDLVCTVAVEDAGVWVDLDTQGDYQRCRQTYE